ncbi:hypothetical protein EGR_09946 [Echinococcus granulosus]|uniref:Uncharacterized protein n=1 Tax=Echinococcus granulosus TaxID=6210 RepID=W6U273_ECHGR|nr:hypothetical protein EGR_09946 [Echinococcus granulosus]EUB55205.1 hypothetical protein EGR_09946 [Echinococcus granulosus]
MLTAMLQTPASRVFAWQFDISQQALCDTVSCYLCVW